MKKIVLKEINNGNQPIMFIFDKTFRLGDRIVFSLFLKLFKDKYPDTKFILFSDHFTFPYLRTFPDEVYFKDLVDEIYVIEHPAEIKAIEQIRKEQNFIYWKEIKELEYFANNNMWSIIPEYRKQGIYPKITIPDNNEEFNNRIRSLNKNNKKMIAFHILDNATYDFERNMNLNNMYELIKLLIKDYFVIRIGEANNYMFYDEDLLDVSKANFPLLFVSSIIANVDLYIGGNTGFTHMAAALDNKIVGLYDCITRIHQNKEMTVVPSCPLENSKIILLKDNKVDINETYSIIKEFIK